MPSIVHTHEREVPGLLHHAVHDPVRGGEVLVAGGMPAGGVDFGRDGFAAQPVAVVVCVAGVLEDGDSLVEEFAGGGDDAQFAGVVAGGAEGCGGCAGSEVGYAGRRRGISPCMFCLRGLVIRPTCTRSLCTLQ